MTDPFTAPFAAFSKISTAFGLSASSGLNAYIPMLLLSIMANRGMIDLDPQYAILKSPWIIAILVVLCIVELVVDKIPGADHVNDVIQTFIRPAAGALVFASQTGTITHVHPGVAIAAGLLTSGAVHGAKSLARPVVNVTTFGVGAPIVSTIENFVSTVLSLIALILPFLTLFFMAFIGWFLFRSFKRFTSKKRPIKVHAEPVPEPAAVLTQAVASPGRGDWGGGV